MEIPILWERMPFQNLLQTAVKLANSGILIGVEILYVSRWITWEILFQQNKYLLILTWMLLVDLFYNTKMSRRKLS